MDGTELLSELKDRHQTHLVYDGPFRLGRWSSLEADLQALLDLFEDWRQRVYRFDNRLGASVVLYRPLNGARMRWDLVATLFQGEEPFSFRYVDAVTANLRWTEVQRLLDRIKAR